MSKKDETVIESYIAPVSYNNKVKNSRIAKRAMELQGVVTNEPSISSGYVYGIDPTPTDIEDLLKYVPTDSVTKIKGSFLKYISDPYVAQLASKYLKDQGAIDFYGNLSDEDRVNYAPSRYAQGYAALDAYSDFLNESISNIINNK